MSIDPKFVELIADVLKIFLYNVKLTEVHDLGQPKKQVQKKIVYEGVI